MEVINGKQGIRKDSFGRQICNHSFTKKEIAYGFYSNEYYHCILVKWQNCHYAKDNLSTKQNFFFQNLIKKIESVFNDIKKPQIRRT